MQNPPNDIVVTNLHFKLYGRIAIIALSCQTVNIIQRELQNFRRESLSCRVLRAKRSVPLQAMGRTRMSSRNCIAIKSRQLAFASCRLLVLPAGIESAV